MATVHTAEEIMQLRRLIGDAVEPYTFADEVVDAWLVEAGGNVKKAASQYWYTKSVEYSTSVDISEAGSSRKNSDLFKNALALAKQYDQDDGEVPPDEVIAPSTTRRIVRF